MTGDGGAAPGPTGRSPIATGVMLAALAAVAFGVTTPIVAWAGRGLGAFSTAALLYVGAAVTALGLRLATRRVEPDARIGRADLVRLIAVGLAGGAIAPTLLAWGLQRTGATTGSLVLNLEAAFTVVLARAVYREPIGARVAVAVLAMTAGGVALSLAAWHAGTWGIAGLAAVAGATAAWALDNTLTRPLAERDPLEVVAGKGAIGGAITVIAALVAGDPRPAPRAALVLLACGATGYGLSLRLYLLAQRRIGAGRTGSVFALAPFVGAAVAYATGDRSGTAITVAAGALFALGVYLHVSERHGHRHAHLVQTHAHAHRHDDDHHDHPHDPPVAGEHTHLHSHGLLEHDHDHAPDLHHDHGHG